MTEKRNPLDPFGVIWDAINEVGGLDRAHDLTGKSVNHLMKARKNLGAGSRFLSYQDIRALVAEGATAPLHDLARLSGATLLPVRATEARACIHTGLASIAKESGEAMASIASALIDGKITPNEASDMCRELLDMQAAVTAMLQQLQSYMRTGD